MDQTGSGAAPTLRQPFYGIDAPGVVRNLAVAAGIFLGAAAIAAVAGGPDGWGAAAQPLAIAAGWMLATAGWMAASSLWLKRRVMVSLLNMRVWHGDECTLDIGSGRGLVAIGMAERAPRGAVTAVDLWSAKDLSGNGPQALLANAAAAGVGDRIIVDTGDACALPYTDASFDCVGAMTVIHNIPTKAGRARAIGEMWRVVKPGGQILLFDIRHTGVYARQLRGLGATVKLSGPILLWGPIGRRLCADRPEV